MISAIVAAADAPIQTAEHGSSAEPSGTATLGPLLETVLAARVDEVICVACDIRRARRQVEAVDQRLFWIWSPAGAREQSSILITGLWASHPQSDGAMFVSADQPLPSKQTLDCLLARFDYGTEWIVAASLDGQPRGPILFRRRLFGQLLTLTGNDTGQSLMTKHPLKTARVEWQQLAAAQPPKPVNLVAKKPNDQRAGSAPTASAIVFNPSRSNKRRRP